MNENLHNDGAKDPLDTGIINDLRALRAMEPRDGFADDVMQRIAAGRRPARSGAVVRLAGWLLRPRTIRVSPLGGLAAAACLLVALGLTFRGGLYRNGTPPAGLAPVKFVLAAPGAHEVAVIGSFNDWNAAGWSMRRDAATGVWTLATALPPGSHEYVFLVDGTPVPDSTAALSAEDGFGSRNSVLMVKKDNESLL